MQISPQQEAFQWQVGVWDRISQLYFREVDPRFAPVVAGTIRRAALVGPGSMADPAPFLGELSSAGIDARVESEELGFDFETFELAWEVLAGVTTAKLEPERREEAKAAVQAAMWPQGRGPRHFRNVTQFLVGRVP